MSWVIYAVYLWYLFKCVINMRIKRRDRIQKRFIHSMCSVNQAPSSQTTRILSCSTVGRFQRRCSFWKWKLWAVEEAGDKVAADPGEANWPVCSCLSPWQRNLASKVSVWNILPICRLCHLDILPRQSWALSILRRGLQYYCSTKGRHQKMP